MSARQARGPLPAMADQVRDSYSGDREGLIRLFPDIRGRLMERGPDVHEHAHHNGCFYAHSHAGGSVPHAHAYRCANESCRHVYERTGDAGNS